LLIAHREAPLHWDGLARWIASWSTLVGVEIIDEPKSLRWKRLKRERRRVGSLRLADVLAFRVWYRLVYAARDARWIDEQLDRLRATYSPIGRDVPILATPSPNSADSEKFIRDARPDIVLALCKNLLKESVFSLPRVGTFVLHPGICPEYRNSHGCFWALAQDDIDNVGVTLLRIDRGIDTGPVFGYFRYPYDEETESHIVIQHRMVLDNLDAIAGSLQSIADDKAEVLPTDGRRSGEWGQPWLTKWWRWKRRARARARARHAGRIAEAR
jgi:hypothetical protein